jgi:3',5'-cyclic AMP phosphodiesterase CpdA
MRGWADDHRLDAVVTTGDNVYAHGLPEDFDAAWNEPYGWVDDAGIPVIAALGNHDMDDEGKTQELELFDIPGAFYTRTVGPVRFVVLDANDPSDPEQLAWLRGELARESDAPWTVVVFHQPAFSCSFHQSTEAVDEQWVPLFGPGGVDLVLNGHDHDYQRFAPIDGVTYVVQGAGGAELYPVSSILCPTGTPSPAFADDDHHLFLTLAASEDHLTGRAITADGDVVDTFDVPGR